MSHKTAKDEIEALVKESLDNVLKKNGVKLPSTEKLAKPLLDSAKGKIKAAASALTEALVLTPKGFLNKTDKLSERTKEAHEVLYKAYVDTFNKVSIKLDSALRDDVSSNSSDFRSLKMDEQYNLNAIKLHELYFGNIGDLASEITYESIPYIKLNQSFGTFEKWQYDFIACCMAAREGWAVTYYEPYRNTYINAIVDSHNVGVPVGCIPVIVMDMWAHSYYKEYANEKKAYVVAMMRELNWNVIEARMIVAERTEMAKLYQIIPMVNNQPEVMLSNASASAMQAPVEPTSIPAPVEKPLSGPGSLGEPVGGPVGGTRQ